MTYTFLKMSTATELKNNIKWECNLTLMQNLWSLTFNYFLPFPLQSKHYVIIFMVNISDPLLSTKQAIRGQGKAKVFTEPQGKGAFLPKAMPVVLPGS